MLIHPLSDEILERLWYLDEAGRKASFARDLRLKVDSAEVEEMLDELQSAHMLRRGDQIDLTPAGEERARGIIRRHRLAEVLFSEVLQVPMDEAEASACELEHTLTERVVDRVCTFLGHPPKCPHGKPIPGGSCCKLFDRRVEPLISRLADLRIGQSAPIVFIAPKSAARLNRLATLGVVPGTSVRLMQRKPSFVIECGETSLALEEEVAGEIYVRA
jgi:DtxR family transcriptional regulator, Mn-dependent transcriptional regulator